MNVIQYSIMIGWTYLAFVVPSIFLLQLGMVSDKNTRRNIFTIITLCSFHKGNAVERWILMSWSESACFRTLSLSLRNLQDMNWQSGFPSSTSLCVLISRFNTTRSAMFMINICVFNHPFKIFRNREHKGVEDLVWGNARETKWIRRFVIRARTW
jgi:hypothetical protein